MNPRVTVLLPTHNRADVIGYAIRSVLWQSIADFEFLVVGDGCADNTAEVVASFDDNRIRWLDLPKAPLSGYANRNVALRRARGDVIAYAQDDDIWFPDHLARLLASLAASAAEWAYSRPLWVTDDGYVLPYAVNLTQADELERFLSERNHIPSNCVMHTRSALERIGYWPEDIPRIGDWQCWRRIIESGSGTAAYCAEPTALHFRQTTNLGPRNAGVILHDIARDAAWWPASCRADVPVGDVPQPIFFDRLASEKAAAVDDIRAGARTILDRLAWEAIGGRFAKRDRQDLRRQWNSRTAVARRLGRLIGEKFRR